ncbi:polyprenyl synthetase family protein [Lacticaseibacillus suihuaensis]
MLEPKTLGFKEPLEAALATALAPIANTHLQAAMRYSVDAGGKRLRPLLLLAVVDSFGGSVKQALPAAAGLELLHTYSLIHDDLPAMDNDDLRRGRPTSHKRFGTAMAILAGDGLQAQAFAQVAAVTAAPGVVVQLLQALAQAAGPCGMVAGQVMDMDGEHHRLDLAALRQLQALKTGALIEAAVAMGGLLAGVAAADGAALRAFAAHFGLAFQIQDDVNDRTKTAAELGKTPNKDLAEAKATFPSLLGLAGAQQALAQEVAAAHAALGRLSRPVPQLDAFLTYFE